MFDELRKYLTGLIKEISGVPVYFEIANDEASTPYIVYDVQENQSEIIHVHSYRLNIDCWDRSSVKNIISIIEKIDKEFMQFKDDAEKFVITIYHGPASGFVDDNDKNVKHFLRSYEITVYEKE